MADVLNHNLIDLMAKYATGNAPPTPSITLKLFVNDITPDCSAEDGVFTECTAPGYAAVALTAGNWGGSTISCVANYTYPGIAFIFTGPGVPGQTIYGYYYVDLVLDLLLWHGFLDTPYVIPAGTSALVIVPSWSDKICSTGG